MNYLYSVITVVAVFSLLTLALNMQFGQGGIINFGLVAFFAVGAFTYAVLTQPPPSDVDQYAIGLEMNPWPAAAIAVAASVVVAFALGKPALRLRPEYLALATFAFAQVLESLLINVRSVANGSIGLSGLEPPFVAALPFESYDLWFMVVSLAVLVVTYLIVHRMVRAPFGPSLRATRDDEIAAAALGKPVAKLRMRAFVLGAAIAGVAGVLYASYATVVSPELFTANVTFTAFIALVIGGTGSNLGAVAGAAIFFGLEELLNVLPLSGDTAQFVATARIIPFGLALILVLRFAPQGLLGSRHARSLAGAA